MPTAQHLMWLGIGVLIGYLALPWFMSLFTRGKGA